MNTEKEPKPKLIGIGVRFPEPVYSQISNMSKITEESINDFMRAGLRWFLNDYIISPEFLLLLEQIHDACRDKYRRLLGKRNIDNNDSVAVVGSKRQDSEEHLVANVARVEEADYRVLTEMLDLIDFKSLNEFLIIL